MAQSSMERAHLLERLGTGMSPSSEPEPSALVALPTAVLPMAVLPTAVLPMPPASSEARPEPGSGWMKPRAALSVAASLATRGTREAEDEQTEPEGLGVEAAEPPLSCW